MDRPSWDRPGIVPGLNDAPRRPQTARVASNIFDVVENPSDSQILPGLGLTPPHQPQFRRPNSAQYPSQPVSAQMSPQTSNNQHQPLSPGDQTCPPANPVSSEGSASPSQIQKPQVRALPFYEFNFIDELLNDVSFLVTLSC